MRVISRVAGNIDELTQYKKAAYHNDLEGFQMVEAVE